MDATLTKKANELAKEFACQATTLEELNEVMRALMKTALERMLNTELDAHLGRVSSTGIQPPDEIVAATGTDSATDAAGGSSKARNRRNGTSPKTIQGDMGRLPLAIPRDRDGTFKPLLLGKYQRRLPGFDEKILALYAKGLTTRDIQDIVKEFWLSAVHVESCVCGWLKRSRIRSRKWRKLVIPKACHKMVRKPRLKPSVGPLLERFVK